MLLPSSVSVVKDGARDDEDDGEGTLQALVSEEEQSGESQLTITQLSCPKLKGIGQHDLYREIESWRTRMDHPRACEIKEAGQLLRFRERTSRTETYNRKFMSDLM